MDNQLQVLETRQDNLVFGSQHNFELAMRQAKCLSASSIVPEIYRGEKGMPNCLIALEMANRIGASPMMVMQNLYVVHGNPGWSSKFLISCLNTCGKFSPLRYEFRSAEGRDDWGCGARKPKPLSQDIIVQHLNAQGYETDCRTLFPN